MARLGLLLTHDGVWNQQRILDEEWVYKMTHPAFEDSNTGYGYLTWSAASKNYSLPLIDAKIPVPFGACQPSALWPEYPHGLSESLDCGYDGDYPCEQEFDVGAFAAVGFLGQLIAGHRGLDLVIVTRGAGLFAFVTTPWDLIRRALIEHDPVYTGDEVAFCEAYAAGEYAPDLIEVP
jgi:CubicO group peptidase (beta-lactamase class C family)